MVSTPSPSSSSSFEHSASPTLRWRPASPGRSTVAGRRLADFAGVLLDFCNLTASLTGGRIPPHEFQTFRSLLDAEGIRHRAYTSHPVFSKTTVRIDTPMDMHRLVCKLPGRMQSVMRE